MQKITTTKCVGNISWSSTDWTELLSHSKHFIIFQHNIIDNLICLIGLSCIFSLSEQKHNSENIDYHKMLCINIRTLSICLVKKTVPASTSRNLHLLSSCASVTYQSVCDIDLTLSKMKEPNHSMLQ